jgi:hypothetical protein
MKKLMLILILVVCTSVFAQGRDPLADTSWVRNNGVLAQRLSFKSDGTAQLSVEFVGRNSTTTDRYDYETEIRQSDGVLFFFLSTPLMRSRGTPDIVGCVIDNYLYLRSLFGEWQEFSRER